MNTVIDNILTRRSVRSFKEQPVKREDIETLLTAAAYAPSGMNRQTFEFTAVTNKDKIQRLARVIEKTLSRQGYDFYKPAALIIPSNDRNSQWGKEDNACALENIFLAAHSLGIGSVWINQLQGICDEKEVRAVLDELGIPKEHIVYGIAALGYPAEGQEKKAEKRAVTRIVE